MTARHFLLIYELAPDYLARREPLRAEHLALAQAAAARGEIVLAGPLTDPFDQAFLLFKAEGPEVAEAFAKADPYVRSGAVASWKVRPWNTVIGADALGRLT